MNKSGCTAATRVSVWAAAGLTAGALWLLVAGYILALYWTPRGAVTTACGSAVYALYFIAASRYPGNAALVASALVLAPALLLGAQPSLMYVAVYVLLGYLACRFRFMVAGGGIRHSRNLYCLYRVYYYYWGVESPCQLYHPEHGAHSSATHPHSPSFKWARRIR